MTDGRSNTSDRQAESLGNRTGDPKPNIEIKHPDAKGAKVPPLNNLDSGGDNHLSPVESAISPDQSAIESAIIRKVIPNLYRRFGPGIVSRQIKHKSLISPEIKEAIHVAPKLFQPVSSWLVSQKRQEQLLSLMMEGDEAELLRTFGDLREKGVSFEDLCLGIIADLARAMNCGWEEDRLDFLDITIAGATMMQVVRDFGRERLPNSVIRPDLTTALITPVPGETHLVGSLIVEKFLKRAGWTVFGGQMESSHGISVLLRKHWFTLVGISLSGNMWLDDCAKLIEQVRLQSLNPDVVIMVGGHVFIEDPHRADEVGADIFVNDAQHAVEIARNLELALINSETDSALSGGTYGRWTSEYPNLNHRS